MNSRLENSEAVVVTEGEPLGGKIAKTSGASIEQDSRRLASGRFRCLPGFRFELTIAFPYKGYPPPRVATPR